MLRLGLADHFGWTVAVTATADGQVVDRRRIELVDADLSAAPVHYDARNLDDAELSALIAAERASVRRTAGAALDALVADLGAPITSMSLRVWPADFPTELAVLRQSPWEARADAVMYRQELGALAEARGWVVHQYVAKDVERDAAQRLGNRADEVLHGPRQRLGSPWGKDHRVALAATLLADVDPDG